MNYVECDKTKQEVKPFWLLHCHFQATDAERCKSKTIIIRAISQLFHRRALLNFCRGARLVLRPQVPYGFVLMWSSKWASSGLSGRQLPHLQSTGSRGDVGPVGLLLPRSVTLPQWSILYIPTSLSGMSGICSRSSSWQVGHCPSRHATPRPTFAPFFFLIVSGAQHSTLHSQTLIQSGTAERPVCGRRRGGQWLPQKGQRVVWGEGVDGTAWLTPATSTYAVWHAHQKVSNRAVTKQSGN